MSGYRQGSQRWVGFYPVKERLMAGAGISRDVLFFMDIGGNMGHDLMELHQHDPDAPGKLILQHVPAVIGQMQQLDPATTSMSCDFHTEQKSRLKE